MAEQSVGMSTGAGDGVVGGYPNTRMTGKDNRSIGNGTLITDVFPAVSGTGTSTLTVSACDIMNNGYFYQNTTNLTIDTSGTGTGNYILVCRVNDTGSAETVIRSASGTTIPLRTVRICLVDTLITARDIYLGSVTVTGGSITAISGYATPSISTSISQDIVSVLQKNTSQTISSALVSTILTFDSMTNSAGNIITTSGGNTITLRVAGTYLFQGYITHQAGATGSRLISLNTGSVSGPSANVLSSIDGTSLGGGINQFYTYWIRVTGSANVTIQITSSVAGEAVTAGRFIVSRI